MVKVLRKITDNKEFGLHHVIEKEYDERQKTYRYTYCQIQELYEKDKKNLAYNPREFKLFDAQTLEYLNHYPGMLGCVYEKGSRHYAQCESVRENIAMVRMCLYQQLFPEGYIFKDQQDRHRKELLLKEVGEAIGATLKHEARKQLFINIFTNPFNFRRLPHAEFRFGKFGVEHTGAAELYKRMLKKQNRKTLNPWLWLGRESCCRDWNLPPIEQTILCKQDIHEAIFHDSHKTDIGVKAPASHLAAEAKIAFESIWNLGTDPIRVNPHRRPVALSDEAAEESIELAHRIIDNWKHINASNDKRAIDEVDLKDRELEKGELLAEIAMQYDKLMADISARRPEVLTADNGGVFAQAKLAMGKLSYLTLLRAIEACADQKDGNLQHELLYIEEHKVPAAYKEVSPKDEQALMAQVEQALKAAEQYRAAKQTRRQSQQEGKAAQQEALRLNANLTQEIHQMHSKLNHTSVHIGAASSWAIPHVQEINAAVAEKNQQTMPPEVTTLSGRAANI